ncbi:MAG: hypothetical protein OHK0039_02450 [Bacteroidia bacterium]
MSLRVFALLAVAAFGLMAMTPPAPKVPVYKVKITKPDGTFIEAESFVGRTVKFKHNKQILAVNVEQQSLLQFDIQMYKVDAREMANLIDFQLKDMISIKKAVVNANQRISHTTDTGFTLEVGVLNDLKETSGPQSNCCTVTCPDGTTIAGCPVRSSCGSCN